MIKVNMHEAKTRLSQLAERALAGEEVIIARDGEPVLRLVPVSDLRPIGLHAAAVGPDFERRSLEPLDAADLETWQ